MAVLKEQRKSTVLTAHADRLEPTPKFPKVQLNETAFALVEKVYLTTQVENSLANTLLRYSHTCPKPVFSMGNVSIAIKFEYPQVRRTFPQRGRRRPFDDEAASANDQIRVPWLHKLDQKGL